MNEEQGGGSRYVNGAQAPGPLPVSRRVGPDCLSALVLDRFVLGELDSAQTERVRAHLAACPACAGALALIEQERAAFARTLMVKKRVDALLTRAQQDRPATVHLVTPLTPLRERVRRLLLVPASAAAAAAALFVLFFAQPRDGEQSEILRPPQPTSTRTKGDFALAAYVQTRDSHVEGVPYSGAPLMPGDRLRFSVSSTRAGYLAILSVDMTGNVSVYFPTYFPTEAAAAARLEPGRAWLLPGAIELDATPGSETVIALRCDSSTSLTRLITAAEEAVAAARARGQSPPELDLLATGCAEARLHLYKSPVRAAPAAPATAND